MEQLVDQLVTILTQKKRPWAWTCSTTLRLLTTFPFGANLPILQQELVARWREEGGIKDLTGKTITVASLAHMRHVPEHTLMEARVHSIFSIPGTSVFACLLTDPPSPSSDGATTRGDNLAITCFLHQRFTPLFETIPFLVSGSLLMMGSLRISPGAPPTLPDPAPGTSRPPRVAPITLLPSQVVVPVISTTSPGPLQPQVAAALESFTSGYDDIIRLCREAHDQGDGLEVDVTQGWRWMSPRAGGGCHPGLEVDVTQDWRWMSPGAVSGCHLTRGCGIHLGGYHQVLWVDVPRGWINAASGQMSPHPGLSVEEITWVGATRGLEVDVPPWFATGRSAVDLRLRLRVDRVLRRKRRGGPAAEEGAGAAADGRKRTVVLFAKHAECQPSVQLSLFDDQTALARCFRPGDDLLIFRPFVRDCTVAAPTPKIPTGPPGLSSIASQPAGAVELHYGSATVLAVVRGDGNAGGREAEGAGETAALAGVVRTAEGLLDCAQAAQRIRLCDVRPNMRNLSLLGTVMLLRCNSPCPPHSRFPLRLQDASGRPIDITLWNATGAHLRHVHVGSLVWLTGLSSSARLPAAEDKRQDFLARKPLHSPSPSHPTRPPLPQPQGKRQDFFVEGDFGSEAAHVRAIPAVLSYGGLLGGGLQWSLLPSMLAIPPAPTAITCIHLLPVLLLTLVPMCVALRDPSFRGRTTACFARGYIHPYPALPKGLPVEPLGTCAAFTALRHRTCNRYFVEGPARTGTMERCPFCEGLPAAPLCGHTSHPGLSWPATVPWVAFAPKFRDECVIGYAFEILLEVDGGTSTATTTGVQQIRVSVQDEVAQRLMGDVTCERFCECDSAQRSRLLSGTLGRKGFWVLACCLPHGAQQGGGGGPAIWKADYFAEQQIQGPLEA
ncbi:hypothetical protein PAPYR_10321 [Paratrimastix pyriformis]|uniref:Cell division control protein 24 OB domain-containing protein n=1 Tax=Paratrimastix pyriformis TaxID=342808 RepID=A0ABQ8U673_9EUKA|nr:hypothetical protein PAPYR_10321 [Paratrimastix pyriformis]